MRNQGRLTDWNDERGFGFITPLGGGATVFAHVSQFPRAQRRPLALDLVTYDLELDDRGRFRAVGIQFLAPTRMRNHRGIQVTDRSSVTPVVLLVPLFFVTLALVGFVVSEAWALLLIDLVMSLLTFVAYVSDKQAAQLGRWRTKEDTLHGMALLGGWPGGLIAQQMYRHKTRKQEFQLVFWFTVVGNLIIATVFIVLSSVPLAAG